VDSIHTEHKFSIQTIYKDINFRSRLEARWALYFDLQSIKWEYEKEGFKFENGVCYLPDFWLPEVHMWAECKPENFTKEERMKVEELVKATKHRCILLVGNPETMSYEIIGGGFDCYIKYRRRGETTFYENTGHCYNKVLNTHSCCDGNFGEWYKKITLVKNHKFGRLV